MDTGRFESTDPSRTEAVISGECAVAMAEALRLKEDGNQVFPDTSRPHKLTPTFTPMSTPSHTKTRAHTRARVALHAATPWRACILGTPWDQSTTLKDSTVDRPTVFRSCGQLAHPRYRLRHAD